MMARFKYLSGSKFESHVLPQLVKQP